MKPGNLTCAAVFLLVSGWLFAACSKSKTELVFTELPVGTAFELNDVVFLSDTLGFVVGGSRYEKGVVFQTTDGGSTWADRSAEPMIKALYGISFPVPDTGFACGYDGKIFRSVDAGLTWQLYQNPLYRAIRAIYFVNSSKGFCVGGDGFPSGYVLATTNGGDLWNSDTPQVELRDVHFFNLYEGIASGYGTILKTNDGGATWYATPAAKDFYVSLSFPDRHTGYAAGYTGSILRTDDGGETWETLRNGNSLLREPWYLNAVCFRDKNTGYVAGDGGRLMKTEDGGKNWMQITNVPDADWNSIFLTATGGYLCGSEGLLLFFPEP